MSTWSGHRLTMTISGSSHGKSVSVLLRGLPAGESVDTDALRRFMSRRSPGRGVTSSPRREADEPIILSGIENGRLNALPLSVEIKNTDVRFADYAFADTPRPGHADYTAAVKWGGREDMSGGGRFSGRMTAPMCAAGGVALQLLAARGIYVGAHAMEIGGERDREMPMEPTAELFAALSSKPLPVLDDVAGERMTAAMLRAREQGDSLGGIVECAAIGLPAGLGDAMFDGAEGRIAQALFAIPAVKGVEFGAGFACARMRGSECNDPFVIDGRGKIKTAANNCGGILGGITDGMPLLLRAAVKPTPSIAKKQRSVSLSRGRAEEIEIRGRHDPCIVPRAVPVVEALTALVLLDMLLEDENGIM